MLCMCVCAVLLLNFLNFSHTVFPVIFPPSALKTKDNINLIKIKIIQM